MDGTAAWKSGQNGGGVPGMKPFELTYLLVQPFMPALHQEVRSRLLGLQKSGLGPAILDVGGRKSHYTIGVPGRITISDLPRESVLQEQLHLGITEQIAAGTVARRSNVDRIVFDDMTQSKLADSAFDCVVAVEVLEHVENDERFVSEVSRVLRPGGVFLSTTPNGDFVTNHNPDHKRHYRREQLRTLLAAHFDEVSVEYAVVGGKLYSLALRSWSLRHPLRTTITMGAARLNAVQSQKRRRQNRPYKTQKLIAVAKKLG
jgi:SAM-dependent methyltransferase